MFPGGYVLDALVVLDYHSDVLGNEKERSKTILESIERKFYQLVMFSEFFVGNNLLGVK